MSKKYHSFYDNLHVNAKYPEIKIQIVSELNEIKPQSSNNLIHLWIPKEFTETHANFKAPPDGFKLIDHWLAKYTHFKYYEKIKYIAHTMYKLPWYIECGFDKHAYFGTIQGVWFAFDDDFIEKIYRSSSSVHVDFLVDFLKTVANMFRRKGAAKVNEWCTHDVGNDLVNEADCFMAILEEFSVLAYVVHGKTIAHLLDDVLAKTVEAYIELEIPCYRKAMLEKRHLNDEEWRQKRWVSCGLQWLTVMELEHMQCDLKYYNCYDSTVMLACQLGMLWNDIYSYPKDNCKAEIAYENRVQKIVHENKQTLNDALHSVANTSNEFMSLFMGIYNNSTKQLKPFLFMHMRQLCAYLLYYSETSRYGWEELPNNGELDKNVSDRD